MTVKGQNETKRKFLSKIIGESIKHLLVKKRYRVTRNNTDCVMVLVTDRLLLLTAVFLRLEVQKGYRHTVRPIYKK